MIHRYYVLFFTVILIHCKQSVQSPQYYPFFRVTSSCECGKYNELSARIVGGTETDPHEHPWMVAIFNKGKMHCGASLINDRYVLTAGHCVNWFKKENLSVILGMHDRILLETKKQGGSVLEIDDLIVHKAFSSDDLHDNEDIALIKLKHPVTFTPEIRPVCLPLRDEDYSQKIAKVTGWGRITQAGDPSRLLKEANVTVISNQDCQKIAIIGEHITDTVLCAYEHQMDACQGDSGGPLVIETDMGIVKQIGVVSWGIGCAEPGVPGVYTRTGSYLKWIASHTEDAIYCKMPV